MTDTPHDKLIKATHAHARMHQAIRDHAAAMREQLDTEREQRTNPNPQPANGGPGS